MSDVNELILKKLEKYGEDVFELAKEALKYSEVSPYQTVAEHLENVARQIIKNRGTQE
ncbi:MAG: hypothetical protein GY749_30990 [Desulfobacteraceae bacterium]|nr:hypothetical protein [Desulfobacteraceae bacterium]